MKNTPEQDTCVAKSLVPGNLKIEACAGGGKTSTLVVISKSLMARSLYAAFNKVTAEEAQEKFPAHVRCQTTHSIAYGAFGAQMHHKLSRPKGGYVNVAGTGSEIALFYKLYPVEDVATAAAMGMYVKRTVERFEQSAEGILSSHHVPKKDMEKVLKVDSSAERTVLVAAKRLWADRIDLSSKVLATHDTYLKLFQLSKPALPYEVIYADEFQDTSPCVMDIILSQIQAKVIMVGDRRQAIYGWRGAVNAMQTVRCDEASLSQSFRYGEGIAAVATAILKNDMIIKGRPDRDSIIGYGVVDRTKPHAYLFRTNAALLSEAVSAVDRGESVKIEIDVKDFVKVLQSALALYEGKIKAVKHERILPYAKWMRMVEEAEEQGGELKRLVGIVENRQAQHIIDVLEHYQAPENPTAIYTTGHKAKGREFDQVILADDFPSHYKKGEWVGLNESEENLLYVAATRTMRVLEVNESVREALEFMGQEDLIQGDAPDGDYHATYEGSDEEYAEIAAYVDSPAYASGGVGVMSGEMAVEAMHREMGLADGDMYIARTVRQESGMVRTIIEDDLPF